MKRILSILLALTMLFACASVASAESTPETIQVAYMLTMNAAEQRQMVQDAVNDLLAEKGLDIQVQFVCIDFASWQTQVNLMLTDGSIDLFNDCFMPTISVLADNGSAAPLDDLIDQYGQGIKDALGDYINCGKVSGVLYGTPKVNAFSSAMMFVMCKDICDELGIDPEAVTDFDTLTATLEKVHAAYPDLTMIANGTSGAYIDAYDADLLGTEDPLGCLLLGEDPTSLTVQNYYESDTFKNLLGYVKQWSDDGFFMKDPLNAQDGSLAYISNGQAFGGFVSYCDEETAVSVQEKSIGKEIYAAQITATPWATTSNITGMMWCVPSLSTHKEAAVKFLNELYSDADLSNLVCNGIEGTHYVLTDEGNITFPDGLDSASTGWPSGMGTFWPNVCITYPWSPDPADIYQQWLASNDTCSKSPALGFTFDSSDVSDEVSACATVVDKYVPALLLNIGDTDTLYSSFLDELQTAGIDDIISAKQTQLNDWAAAQ
jgi:putative aldouronate transport system substrate-binding protein